MSSDEEVMSVTTGSDSHENASEEMEKQNGAAADVLEEKEENGKAETAASTSNSKATSENGDEEESKEDGEPPAKKSKTEEGAVTAATATAQQPSPVPDDPDVKIVEDKMEKKDVTEKTEEKGKKKEPELTSSEALLNKLEEYVDDALNKKTNVERKVLDALLGAINIQVQKEPLSVRKLILEKQLVLPNTISFPPSQVVDLLIEHDPDFPLAKVISKMFPDERPKLTDAEKKEKHALKQSFGAPHMTKVLMEIGQDLVQEATYCDIVHARNLPETPKNLETYKQVAAQLKPVWESLKKKNEPYKMKLLACQICGFKTESRLVMLKHRSQPHFTGKVYQCAMCPEFDTNEQRLINHYIEVHEVVPQKEEPALRNPCYVCDEDFQLKGQREAHYKMCKRDFHRLRHIMGPKSPEDICMLNRWLWEKPPLDPSILAQQQQAQQQQLKQQRAAMAAAAAAQAASAAGSMQLNRQAPGRPPANLAASLQSAMQQQLMMQQRMRMNAASASQPAAQSLQARQQNTLIMAMQQHLQRAAAAGAANQRAPAAATAAHAALMQRAALQQQAMAAKAGNGRSAQHQQQMPSLGRSPASTAAASPANVGSLLCEICDQPLADKEKYLLHVQAAHKQLKGRLVSDMQAGAPLACSRCRDRFWTYEGLERHLVMSHGLVTQDLLQKAQKKEDGGRCKICSKQYAFNMLQHLVADHSIKLCSAEIMYSCDVCSFKCQSYQKLEVHLSTVHPKNAAEKAAATPSNGTSSSAKKAVAADPAECITLDD